MMGGVLIADEMGLGKTVQALAVLEARNAYPALIVCPASLRINWKRESSKWLPQRTVEVIGGTKGEHESRWADIIVVNYDVLHSWVDSLPELSAMVLDESHYVKNGATTRARAAIQLSDRMKSGAVRMCLSGTPIVNAPGEIVTQLRFLQRIGEFGGVGVFRRRYGNGENLDELNRRLRASCMVRRRKIEVLDELPPKRWATVTVEGESRVMRQYRHAEVDVVTHLANEARRAAEESGATTEEARRIAWERATRVGAAQKLVAIGVLRRLASEAKLEAAQCWITDFLKSDKKLVIFAHHREILELIGQRFADGCVITGDTSMKERQAAVDRFQEDPECRVIVCSLKAAGVGLTLTAASDVLFIEQGWTPADMDQAADRCHRFGQTDSVTAWVMICAHTIDEAIAELISAKRSVVMAATDGGGSILGDLLVDLASRGLETRGAQDIAETSP